MSRWPSKSLEERFWEKVKITEGKDDCWEWQAGVNENGYGRIQVYRNGKHQATLAHRVSYMLTYGKWPIDNLLHSCDNPRCVRPTHLSEGDQIDNMQDASAKGRLKRDPSWRPLCKRGHLLSGTNVYEHSGRRHCRTCKNAWKREKRALGVY